MYLFNGEIDYEICEIQYLTPSGVLHVGSYLYMQLVFHELLIQQQKLCPTSTCQKWSHDVRVVHFYPFQQLPHTQICLIVHGSHS